MWSKYPSNTEYIKKLIDNKNTFVPTNVGKLISIDKVHKLFSFNNRVYDCDSIELCSLIIYNSKIHLCGRALDGMMMYTKDELLNVLKRKRTSYLNDVELRIKYVDNDALDFNYYKSEHNTKDKYIRQTISEIITDFELIEMIYSAKVITTNKANEDKLSENKMSDFENEIDVLRKLKILKDEGILTDDEFNEKKRNT